VYNNYNLGLNPHNNYLHTRQQFWWLKVSLRYIFNVSCKHKYSIKTKNKLNRKEYNGKIYNFLFTLYNALYILSLSLFLFFTFPAIMTLYQDGEIRKAPAHTQVQALRKSNIYYTFSLSLFLLLLFFSIKTARIKHRKFKSCTKILKIGSQI